MISDTKNRDPNACTSNTTYKHLQKRAEELGQIDTIFSIFEIPEGGTQGDAEWHIKAPKLTRTIPIRRGKWILKLASLKPGNHLDDYEMVYSPKWPDIFKYFERVNNGHHIYLEYLYIDEAQRTITITTGS